MGAPDTTFTLAAAKEHLRVTWNDEDALISRLLDSAVGVCEQYTRRAFTERVIRTFVAASDRAGPAQFVAPLWPVKEVKVSYDPGSGSVDLSAGTYRITTHLGYDVLAIDSWPGNVPSSGNVAQIEWKLAPADVPAEIIGAVHLALGDLYANRESQIVGTVVSANATLKAILDPYVTDLYC